MHQCRSGSEVRHRMIAGTSKEISKLVKLLKKSINEKISGVKQRCPSVAENAVEKTLPQNNMKKSKDDMGRDFFFEGLDVDAATI